MGPTSTSRNVPYSLSTPQSPSGRVPPPSIRVRNCISRHRRRERLSFVDDPGRHARASVIARRRDEAVHRAARIEETVAGFEQPIGLAPGLEYQGPFEDIAGLVARVRVIADRRPGRHHGRPDHDFLARHARLIVAFEYGSYRLGGRL